jgi:preprotein translocase subunit SecD
VRVADCGAAGQEAGRAAIEQGGNMTRRKTWVIVIVAALAGLMVFAGLPLLGLVIIYRHELSDALFGTDIASATRLVYEVQPLTPGGEPPDVVQVCRVLRERLNSGTSHKCVVRPLAEKRLEVLIPTEGDGPGDVESVKRLVRQVGVLEFRIMADKVKDREKMNFDRLVRLKKEGQPIDTTLYRWCPLKKGYQWYKKGLLDSWYFVYVVDNQSQTVEALVDMGDGQDVGGRDVAKAYPSSQEGDPIIAFQLRPDAGRRFAKLTGPENRNRYLAIILDGEIQSVPTLRATLSTGGIIEGYRDNRSERDLVVRVLNSGDLGGRLGEPVSEETVGPPAR